MLALLLPVALLAGLALSFLTGDAFYLVWAAMLLAQNAAFTMVSRARNSGSDWYHAFAAVGSNGVWLMATFFTFDKVFYAAITEGFTLEVFGASLLYVICTVIGSVCMGSFLRRFVERGNRQVGHYDKKQAAMEALETAVISNDVRLDRLEDATRKIAAILERSIARNEEIIERARREAGDAVPPDAQDFETEEEYEAALAEWRRV
jgi:hypothetical protein